MAEKNAKKKLTPKQEALKNEIIGKVNRHFGKVMEEATPHMIYLACALTVRDRIMENGHTHTVRLKKRVQRNCTISHSSF